MFCYKLENGKKNSILYLTNLPDPDRLLRNGLESRPEEGTMLRLEEGHMARHNEVTLYGQIMQPTRLLYNTSDESNPSRKMVRTIGTIAVLRGIRDFGAVDKRIRLDIPIVLSQNEKIMKAMAGWEVGDIVFIKGTLATVNIQKGLTCPFCQMSEKIDGMLSFINPIFMKSELKKLSAEEGNVEMRRNAEISNKITVIGKACIDPEVFYTDKGQIITNYQLDIPRKYRIKEDDESNRHDFPFVKSYGFVADNDGRAVRKNGLVFVDGAIQTREYVRKRMCLHCGAEYEYRETATEIVPYSTEYLMGCKTMEEIELEKRQEALEAGAQAREAIFGES